MKKGRINFYHLIVFVYLVVSFLEKAKVELAIDISVHIVISFSIIIILTTIVARIIRIHTPGAGPYWELFRLLLFSL
ncbi:hypothetical protein [Thermococcus nautili]|uniref:Uncharacterized protein n=1 Tax=Thermococcus nautili TaxID=195522 RepID=W8PLY5_9EURY|nr:hypothetical protein [Thermococcus nautili]AHL23079.1 hypothetical protein BD01_1468 [Thermococcus nautili]